MQSFKLSSRSARTVALVSTGITTTLVSVPPACNKYNDKN